MCNPEPFQLGESLTIVHDGGHTATVEFCGMFGAKFDQAYVRWPMAGEYKVKLVNGRLSPSKVSCWRIGDTDLKRLAATRLAEIKSTRERANNRRSGRGEK